jgi:hypothetical protein
VIVRSPQNLHRSCLGCRKIVPVRFWRWSTVFLR